MGPTGCPHGAPQGPQPTSSQAGVLTPPVRSRRVGQGVPRALPEGHAVRQRAGYAPPLGTSVYGRLMTGVGPARHACHPLSGASP
jgi:hypothetical protein